MLTRSHIVFPLLHTWRRSRAVAVACLLGFGLVPVSGLAQETDGLAARVRNLETEITALKIMVGTLESLVRTRPGSALGQDAPASAQAQDDFGPRVEALETQIGALTNQIEQIGKQMSRLEASLDAVPQTVTPAPHAAAPQIPAPQVQSPPPAIPGPVSETDASGARWYGPQPGQVDDGSPQPITPGAATGGSPDPDSEAQALYEQGYGDYLQRDYAGAETAFSQLVKNHPDDPLAGSAKYWVGESYFVRKQYKKAADTFLAGYRKYSASDKAPDMLLKLGMSLAELGQKDAACSTFKELTEKFPDDDLSNQAKGEAGKAGC
jgi:tol-pal system protein YbgF